MSFIWSWQFAAGAVTALASVGLAAAGYSSLASPDAPADSFTCTPAAVWDGDSFTCAEGRKVRLAAVAAGEIKRVTGRMVDAGCKEGHPCPTVDAVTARDKLVSLVGSPIGTGEHGHVLVKGRALRCTPHGSAGGERIGAWCAREDGTDLSCAMVRSGTALRWAKFDRAGRLCR